MSMSSKQHLVKSLQESVFTYIQDMLAYPDALRGQQLRGGGPIADFEALLSEVTGFPHCLATSSATSALTVAALAAGLRGKQVLVNEDAWCGSKGALELAGVELVEVKDFLACPFEGIAAILATDQDASRHDSNALRQKCDESGILYIEDTGWIPGFTAPHGQPSLAEIQVISFGPGKSISLGEGGALLCRSRTVYEKAVNVSQHPERSITEGIPGASRPLLNARMHPVSAILGVSLLKQKFAVIDWW